MGDGLLPQTIAFVNQKGGVGKTTLVMNLAPLFRSSGRRPLVLDADPQESAARWAAAFNGPGRISVRRVDTDQDIVSVSREIGRFAGESRSDLLLLDCPADLRGSAEAALLLADLILIPVTPSPLDIWATAATVKLARRARQVRGDGRPRIALVPNRLSRGTAIARDLPPTLMAMGEEVAPGITDLVVLAESAIVGQTVSQYNPKSRAYTELGTLSRFILERLDA
jgi:chromosome partitioning protein